MKGMSLLSWRRHQGTVLKNHISILPVSDPGKQAAKVVKHHVFVLSSNTWCFTTWAACFPGSDTRRIEMRFLSTVPWCLLQLSNHSPFIKHIIFTTWTACFAGSDTGRIKTQFLSIVPWCLLQLSNRIRDTRGRCLRIAFRFSSCLIQESKQFK
jgi:hypothetical protein